MFSALSELPTSNDGGTSGEEDHQACCSLWLSNLHWHFMDTISLYNWILAGHLTFSLPPPAKPASSLLFQQRLLFTAIPFSSVLKKEEAKYGCGFGTDGWKNAHCTLEAVVHLLTAFSFLQTGTKLWVTVEPWKLWLASQPEMIRLELCSGLSLRLLVVFFPFYWRNACFKPTKNPNKKQGFTFHRKCRDQPWYVTHHLLQLW